jgi:serine protease inhibitor
MIGLEMALTGAKGVTAQELKNVLDLSSVKDDQLLEMNRNYSETLSALNNENLLLNMANKIYSKKDFQINERYKTNLVAYFQSEIQSLDFNKPVESAAIMNDWISNKTNNRIQNIIDSKSIDQYSILFLINTIYFKGLWSNRFNQSLTKLLDFYLNKTSKINVLMMGLKGKTLSTQINPAGLEAVSCRLTYIGRISMTILLPNRNSSIEQLEKSLTSKHLKSIITKFNFVKTDVYLPKFKITFKSEVFTLKIKNFSLRFLIFNLSCLN